MKTREHNEISKEGAKCWYVPALEKVEQLLNIIDFRELKGREKYLSVPTTFEREYCTGLKIPNDAQERARRKSQTPDLSTRPVNKPQPTGFLFCPSVFVSCPSIS